MRRRDLLAAACPQPGPAVDAERMNRFAAEWNGYIEKLKTGVVDVKHWDRIVKAFERLK